MAFVSLVRFFFLSLNYNNSFSTTVSSSGFLCCALLYRTDASKQRISSKNAVEMGGRAEMAVFASITAFHSSAVKLSTMFPLDRFRKSSSSLLGNADI